MVRENEASSVRDAGIGIPHRTDEPLGQVFDPGIRPRGFEKPPPALDCFQTLGHASLDTALPSLVVAIRASPFMSRNVMAVVNVVMW